MPNGEPTFSEKTFGAQGQPRMAMGPDSAAGHKIVFNAQWLFLHLYPAAVHVYMST